MTVLSTLVVRSFPLVPRPLVRRIASRYIAGTTLADGLEACQGLNRRGCLGAMTVLGEDVEEKDAVDATLRAYLDVLALIDTHKLRAYMGVKPSSFGLEIDPALCLDSYRTLAISAAKASVFVRIEMEDAETTDETLRIYRELRDEGIENVGITLQASLHRTLADVRDHVHLRPNVRLCKGIYIESPSIQHKDPDAVRKSFMRCADELLEGGAYLAVASHDPQLVRYSLRRFSELGLERDAYEFQMLQGVATKLGATLVADGHQLRVAVVFGSQWYEYARRRFRENPQLAAEFARDLVRRAGFRRSSS